MIVHCGDEERRKNDALSFDCSHVYGWKDKWELQISKKNSYLFTWWVNWIVDFFFSSFAFFWFFLRFVKSN